MWLWVVVFEIKSGYNHAKEIENIITVKENKCTLFCIEIEIWKKEHDPKSWGCQEDNYIQDHKNQARK